MPWALAGDDGYLFLAGDTNAVISQITGKIKVSSDLADLIASSHNTRRALCAAAGAVYRHVICPNKESVLTGLLPPDYRFESSGQSVVNQLIGRGFNSFYDRELLADAAQTEPIFTRLDSRWSEVGAALRGGSVCLNSGLRCDKWSLPGSGCHGLR